MSTVPAQPPAKPAPRALTVCVFIIAAAALLFSVFHIFTGFHHSIFEFHAFRQAQTAISADSMQHGGPFLRYETPVFGPPWSVPFEFPLYQKIVAVLAQHLNTPLIETGRAVSIVFFYLCFFPLASILRRLGYAPFQVLAVLAFLAVSPLYIFVSRLFMIESTALFLSLAYTEQIVRLCCGTTRWRYPPILLAALFGALAGAVKVTTFAPFLLFGSCLAAWRLWNDRRRAKLSSTRIALAGFCCVSVPFLCTLLWTKFADHVKSENALSRPFTSNRMTHWNFGTTQERLTPANYLLLLRGVSGYEGSVRLLILLVLAYALLVRRWNWRAVLCLALYLFTSLTFFNLHLIHEYYPYASVIFLIVGAGLLLADLMTLPGWRAWIGFAFLVLMVAAAALRYMGRYDSIQRSAAPGMPDVAGIVDGTTRAGDVIVITGLDWSAELPFQSHRRAIMYRDPRQVSDASTLAPLFAVLHNQGPQSASELVACDSSRGTPATIALLHLLDIAPSNAFHTDRCDIYARSPPS